MVHTKCCFFRICICRAKSIHFCTIVNHKKFGRIIIIQNCVFYGKRSCLEYFVGKELNGKSHSILFVATAVFLSCCFFRVVKSSCIRFLFFVACYVLVYRTLIRVSCKCSSRTGKAVEVARRLGQINPLHLLVDFLHECCI